MNTCLTRPGKDRGPRPRKSLLAGFYIGFSLLVLAILFCFPAIKTANASGVPANWQRGVTLFPQSSTDFASSNTDLVIQKAKQTNANYITLIIPLQQDNIYSTNIYRASFAPSDASIAHAAATAHSQGLKVALKIHLDPQDGQWRANINPGDRTTWYLNYSNMLNGYATLAQQNGIEELVVGAELISMATYSSNTDNTVQWHNMISQVRQRFSGLLTYSANWGGSYFGNEVAHIGFWGDLDFIGISAYYNLSDHTNPTVQELMNTWNNWNSTSNDTASSISSIQQQYKKPVLFTEVGYRSVDGAAIHPWDWSLQGNYNPQEQVNAIQALLQYWGNYSWFAGFQYWLWETNPTCCGTGDTGYSFQNKPALDTMKNGLFSPGPQSFYVYLAVDNGLATDANNLGTLSYALQRAGAGDVINLAPVDGSNLLKIKGQLPPAKPGVQIIGSNCGAAPHVTISGAYADPNLRLDGLTLNNNVFIKGITLGGFSNKQVVFNPNGVNVYGVKMECVKITKNL